MVGAGCAVWGLLLLGLPSLGVLISVQHGTGIWGGLACGMVTWLAAVAGHAAALSVVDWWQRERYPDRIGVPKSVIAGVWVFFVAATLTAIALWRRLYAG